MSAGSSRGAGPSALFTLPRWLLKHCAYCCGTNEHAEPGLTVKVSFALYLSIVLASGIVQFDANPISNCEVSSADEADRGLSSVGQGDDRALGYLLAGHRECKDRKPTTKTC